MQLKQFTRIFLKKLRTLSSHVVTCRHMSHVVTIDIVWHLAQVARTPVSSLLHLLRPTGCQLRFRCGLPQLPSMFNVFHSDIETTSIHITYFPTFVCTHCTLL